MEKRKGRSVGRTGKKWEEMGRNGTYKKNGTPGTEKKKGRKKK